MAFPLVGRDRERVTTTQVLADARRGRGRVLHIVGEPGMGKSRLLDELVQDAEISGATVLRGRADQSHSEHPYAVVIDAMDDHLRSLGPARCLALARVPLMSAAGVFPSLAALAGEPSEQSAGAFGLHLIIRHLLEGLATERPIVLALDDVQWADEAALDLLTHLSRRPARAVLVALAYRSRASVGRLASVGQGDGAGRTVRVELAPLTVDDIDLLIPDVSPTRRRSLHRVSGGNPFYLQALLRSVGGRLTAPLTDQPGPLPPQVRAALVAELDTLPSEVRTVALGAAVAGDPYEPELVAAIVECAAAPVMAAIDDLVAHEICTADPAPRHFRFRHPLVRRVAYDLAGAAWRSGAHERAAAELERAHAPAPSRAHHVEMAARAGDMAAVRLLVQAAGEVADHAPSTAAGWYAAALRLSPADVRPELRARVELSRAHVLSAAGRLLVSRDAAHAAIDLLAPDDPSRPSAVAFCALVEELLGRHDESDALLRAELDRIRGEAAGVAVAELWLGLASTGLMRGDFDAARSAAEKARASGSETADQELTAVAESIIALSRFTVGDVTGARLSRDAAAAAVDALPDAALARRLDAGIWLGWAEMFLERYDDALRHLTRSLHIARRGAHQHLLTHLLVGLGSTYKTRGDLDAATEAFEEAADAAEVTGSAQLRIMAAGMQCRVATWTGDLAAAESYGEQARGLAAGAQDWFAAVVGALLAQARLTGGDATSCVEAVLAAGGGEDLPVIDPGSRADWYEVLTRAALQADDVAGARNWSQRARRTAEHVPLVSPAAFADLAEARVAAAVGDQGAASWLATCAAATFDRVGNRLDGARAHMAAGLAHAAASNRGEALHQLGIAERAFADCGADRLRDEAAAALRRLGHRLPRQRRTRTRAGAQARTPAARSAVAGSSAGGAAAGSSFVAGSPTAADPLASLSPREREVAALVSAGHTNRKIASLLFVSEKTVESHLSHIFTKVGVGSRAALAALTATAPDRHRATMPR